jgi:uncharacterized Zn finger protein
MAWYRRDFKFPEYVSVKDRRARAQAEAEKLARKQKRTLSPVAPIDGTKLVQTFWGKAWCDNLESYGDYASRLPRGRSYVRHGAVIDLQIAKGQVSALVSGTSTYRIAVTIGSLPAKAWGQLASECTGRIDSLVDLLRGTLPDQVMQVVTRKQGGLFPAPQQISFQCSCPDVADMCKHVAATLYAVGVRLDEKPELFFELRGVDHTELIGGAADAVPALATGAKGRKVIKGADLSALFGIELDAPANVTSPPPARNEITAKPRGKKSAPKRAPNPKRT